MILEPGSEADDVPDGFEMNIRPGASANLVLSKVREYMPKWYGE